MPGTNCNRRTALAALLLVAACVAVADAAQPRISIIDPPGMRRGGQVELVVRGERLGDAEDLLFYEPGLNFDQLEKVDGKSAKVKVSVAPDCRLGLHALRVRTSTGISNLWTVAVGALPEVAETEPNSNFEQPQEIPQDVTVNGVITKEDVDYFVVMARKGDRLTAELEGIRLGLAFFDPYVAILNPERFELARSDDSPLLRQDSLCSILVPADGRYIVQVRDSAFEGSDRCKYRLHVGRFPRPTAILPAGGSAGATIDATWIGDVKGPQPAAVTLPPEDQLTRLQLARAPLTPQDDAGIAPSPLRVRISQLPNVMEAEPNDIRDKATPFIAPAAVHGVIGQEGDVDHFRFQATKGQAFDIRVFARRILRSPLDTVLRIREASGKHLASNDDDNGGSDSYIRFTAPADGDFVIELHDQLKQGGVDYAYRIEVAPVRPQLVMRLPEREKYFSTTLEVPRGNRMALMVSAQRADWGGDVHMEMRDLPAGVTAQVVPIPNGRDVAPVLFSAAVDAPPAARLVDIVGWPAEHKPDIQGHLDQRTMLVRGRNNRDVWGHHADRMAAVVTTEVPFQIEIVAPQAPLVRNGAMDLKVVARRNEGFQAPIAVTMLYNPPGVASRGTITIPEGQHEAVIPLTANGSAEIRRWPIVVIGRGPAAAGGSVEVASQMIELDVADRYFDLAFDRTAVQQGQAASLGVKITTKRTFAGTAKVEVLGLPRGATCEPLEFAADAKDLVLPIQTAADAQIGRHATILCRVVVTEKGEPVTHTLGTGELRIDAPPPEKKVVVEAKPEPKPAAAPQLQALSRLQQLRKQRADAKEQ